MGAAYAILPPHLPCSKLDVRRTKLETHADSGSGIKPLRRFVTTKRGQLSTDLGVGGNDKSEVFVERPVPWHLHERGQRDVADLLLRSAHSLTLARSRRPIPFPWAAGCTLSCEI